MTKISSSIKASTSSSGSAFYLSTTLSSSFASLKNKFHQCGVSGKDEDGGGIFYINDKIKFTDESSNYTNISAL